MSDIYNIMSIYQSMHLETTDWQMQTEPFDDAMTQQHLFHTFCKLHNEIKKCIRQMNNDDFVDDDAHDEWQGRVEELQQQMMRLMRSGAFVAALESKWKHLNDNESSRMNTFGDANQYYLMFLDQMAE